MNLRSIKSSYIIIILFVWIYYMRQWFLRALFKHLLNIEGLLWWLRWWRISLECRRPEFDPRVEKILWRRKWQPTPVFLPGESHGQRSLAGYSPCGHKYRHLNIICDNVVLGKCGYWSKNLEYEFRRCIRVISNLCFKVWCVKIHISTHWLFLCVIIMS